MKYTINIFSILIFTWPAMVLGYLWGAVSGGFIAGIYLHEKHADEALAKFTNPR